MSLLGVLKFGIIFQAQSNMGQVFKHSVQDILFAQNQLFEKQNGLQLQTQIDEWTAKLGRAKGIAQAAAGEWMRMAAGTAILDFYRNAVSESAKYERAVGRVGAITDFTSGKMRRMDDDLLAISSDTGTFRMCRSRR